MKKDITRHHQEYEITLQKEDEKSDWYIIVFSDAGYSYDGYWRSSQDKNEDEAFKEALDGACIS